MHMCAVRCVPTTSVKLRGYKMATNQSESGNDWMAPPWRSPNLGEGWGRASCPGRRPGDVGCPLRQPLGCRSWTAGGPSPPWSRSLRHRYSTTSRWRPTDSVTWDDPSNGVWKCIIWSSEVFSRMTKLFVLFLEWLVKRHGFGRIEAGVGGGGSEGEGGTSERKLTGGRGAELMEEIAKDGDGL